jgi:uncharacterized protein YndB with AHSA1/START domain
MEITHSGSATVTLPSDREIVITRVFDAPVQLVFEAMTKPEHVRRWWGLRGGNMVVCDIDLRVGGAWRYAFREEDGSEFGFHGVYQEISPPGRWVSTEVFEGFPDAESINTVTLVEEDGKTRLTTVVLHQNREYRDGHLNSGMEPGMQQTLDRLEELLATIA